MILFGILSFVALIMYQDRSDPAPMVFVTTIILGWVGIPRIFDLLKEWLFRKVSQPVAKTNDRELKERLENLEGLICRLDSEINYQLEQSLSSGKLTTSSSPAAASQMPTTFMNVAAALEGRYQVLKELGRGGMGIVFQAQDKQLNEQVAVKILSPLLSHDTDAITRMKREVTAARRITHPNVIRIHDFAEANGLYYVSMEFFHGTSLKDHIKQSGSLSQMQAFNVASQLCDGLEAAHRQGVVHRDLKSQNIIIDQTNHVKIIDFGLARTAQLEGMTATGLIMGTPEYMAPEQVAGKKVDERADIYSLGIILYELFTGQVPFKGDSAIAVGFKQLREAPTAPHQINAQISPELEALILKALEKDPAMRFRSVSELKSALENAILQPQPALKAESSVRKQERAKTLQ